MGISAQPLCKLRAGRAPVWPRLEWSVPADPFGPTRTAAPITEWGVDSQSPPSPKDTGCGAATRALASVYGTELLRNNRLLIDWTSCPSPLDNDILSPLDDICSRIRYFFSAAGRGSMLVGFVGSLGAGLPRLLRLAAGPLLRQSSDTVPGSCLQSLAQKPKGPQMHVVTAAIVASRNAQCAHSDASPHSVTHEASWIGFAWTRIARCSSGVQLLGNSSLGSTEPREAAIAARSYRLREGRGP